jgi:hypothetical protein
MATNFEPSLSCQKLAYPKLIADIMG